MLRIRLINDFEVEICGADRRHRYSFWFKGGFITVLPIKQERIATLSGAVCYPFRCGLPPFFALGMDKGERIATLSGVVGGAVFVNVEEFHGWVDGCR